MKAQVPSIFEFLNIFHAFSVARALRHETISQARQGIGYYDFYLGVINVRSVQLRREKETTLIC